MCFISFFDNFNVMFACLNIFGFFCQKEEGRIQFQVLVSVCLICVFCRLLRIGLEILNWMFYLKRCQMGRLFGPTCSCSNFAKFVLASFLES